VSGSQMRIRFSSHDHTSPPTRTSRSTRVLKCPMIVNTCCVVCGFSFPNQQRIKKSQLHTPSVSCRVVGSGRTMAW
jgi:hypothetical protein